MRSKFILLALLSLSVWLAGCQSSGVREAGSSGKGDFETLGKLALRAPGESLSVRFRWRQTGERYDLELWGPFGLGRTRLVGDTQQMSVLDGQGQTLSRGEPQLVVRKQIGWELPLLALVSWAQGVPRPNVGVSEVSRDPQGRYVGFVQENWSVQYPAYDDSSPSRPKRIALATGDYRVKVVFNRWLPPSPP